MIAAQYEPDDDDDGEGAQDGDGDDGDGDQGGDDAENIYLMFG